MSKLKKQKMVRRIFDIPEYQDKFIRKTAKKSGVADAVVVRHALDRLKERLDGK